MKEKRYHPFTSKYIIMLLAIIGFAAVFWGIFLAADYAHFIKTAVSTEAVITDTYIHHLKGSRRICDAYLEYTVDGKNYKFVIYNYASGSSYNMREKNFLGRRVKLLYNPANPAQSRTDEEPYGRSALIVMAGIASWILCAYFNRRNRYYQKLFASGAVLDAVVTDIEHKTVVYRGRTRARGIFGAGRKFANYTDEEHYSIIVCQWNNPVTGEVYVFRSVRVKEFVEPYVGQTIRVYADPSNYEKYFVDVDSLLAQPFLNGKSKPFTFTKQP